ncbi:MULTISPECIES: phosphotransferase [unclassified Minwuia]|uniref:aminoglycoside phosphotransferase family protein n=1 Tax=unclassified Minwuia TaxID=2618799 RepID=UPI0024797DBA|nr:MULTISPECIES: phosphotransferase [unclassified Minwuia]
MEPDRQNALQSLLQGAGLAGSEVRPLAADASFRSYHRVHGRDGRVLVLMDAPPVNEDVRPFVRIAKQLRQWGLSAPEVVAEDAQAGFLLLEDLGDDLFSHLIGDDPSLEPKLYTAAIDVLAALKGQQVPSDLPRHDAGVLLSEVALFLEWRFPEMHGRPASGLETDSFLDAWRQVLQGCRVSCDTLVLRDYHVDNLIWLPERTGNARVGLLDFQDAVGGDPAYDVASLLSDVRRDIDPGLASDLLAHYLETTGLDGETFRARLAVLGAQRNMRILGVFTRLWRRDGKPSYTGWLARTWRLVRRDLEHDALAPVRDWVAQHAPQDRQADEMERRD